MKELSFTSLSPHTSIFPSSPYSFILVASIFIVWYYDYVNATQVCHVVYCDYFPFPYKICFPEFKICLFLEGGASLVFYILLLTCSQTLLPVV